MVVGQQPADCPYVPTTDSPTITSLSLDWLFRQSRAGKSNRRLASRQHVRASECRQRRGTHRSQLSFDHSICRGRTARRTHYSLRSLRLWRCAGGTAKTEVGTYRQLAASRPGRARQASFPDRFTSERGETACAFMRVKCNRAGGKREPNDGSA